MVEAIVIYDDLNNQAWVDWGEHIKSFKNRFQEEKKFRTTLQAKAYAIRLGKKYGIRVFDRSIGKYTSAETKSPSSNILSPNIFGGTSYSEITKGVMD